MLFVTNLTWNSKKIQKNVKQQTTPQKSSITPFTSNTESPPPPNTIYDLLKVSIKRYRRRKTHGNPIQQNLHYCTWYSKVLFHFSVAVHTDRRKLVPRNRPKKVSPSLREYPICNRVHSYSIPRMGTKINPPPRNKKKPKKSLEFPTKPKQHSGHPVSPQIISIYCYSRSLQPCLSPKLWILNFSLTYSRHCLRLEANVVCNKLVPWNSFTSQYSKLHALFRQCFVTLRSNL